MTSSELQSVQAKVAQQFAAKKWHYADKDPLALAELKTRIDVRVRKRSLQGSPISYSNLVYKLEFNLPNFNKGKPYQIDVDNWTQGGSVIIGDFLCYISMESFIDPDRAFLASALVVSSKSRRPSDGFYDLARELGLLEGSGPTLEERFWQTEMGYIVNPSTILNRVVPFK